MLNLGFWLYGWSSIVINVGQQAFKFLVITIILFQVKSVIPFSEPFTVDPENPPPEKDYNIYFKTLKDGITGKELLEQTPAPVWFLFETYSTESIVGFIFGRPDLVGTLKEKLNVCMIFSATLLIRGHSICVLTANCPLLNKVHGIL